MVEEKDRYAEIERIVAAAKDYNPKIPTPEVYPCPVADCDNVMEWRVEFAIHMSQEHPNVCMYCKEIVPGLWHDWDKREHRAVKHPDLCPICEDSESYNLSTKILHLRKWHANDETIRKEGISVYLR